MRTFFLTLASALVLLTAGNANAKVYVNTDLPGIKKVHDNRTGKDKWVDSMGNYLCDDSEMAPLSDMDKDDIAYEVKTPQQGRVVIDPVKNGITKKWDNKRKAWIWVSKTGDYYGRVPTELQQKNWEKQQKALQDQVTPTDQAKSSMNKKLSNGTPTDGADSAVSNGDFDMSGINDEAVMQMLQQANGDVDSALAQVREAKKQLKEVMAQGYGQYVEGVDLNSTLQQLDYAEKMLLEYKNNH